MILEKKSLMHQHQESRAVGCLPVGNTGWVNYGLPEDMMDTPTAEVQAYLSELSQAVLTCTTDHVEHREEPQGFLRAFECEQHLHQWRLGVGPGHAGDAQGLPDRVPLGEI